DLSRIAATLSVDVRYTAQAPCYADDTDPFALTDGIPGYLQVWDNLGNWFSDYTLTINELLPVPAMNQAVTLATVVATPAVDFEGLPAGKPYTYPVAALMEFDEDGKMAAETAYGNFIMVGLALRRMREFIGSSTAPVRGPQWHQE
ncbi:MAG: nuclear transport factor 2 family protein, partial [Mycobacterium sp.]|nr:nuclear transport factor 2 family protein [Mycobacterium sp.]